MLIPLVALLAATTTMIAELGVSRRHERALRAIGAIPMVDPDYAVMRWMYPGLFVAMAVEGAVRSSAPGRAVMAGAVLFVSAKALKYWAIGALGGRWSYRVYVVPGAPLVERGPYALLRHPNYVAVMGEIVGMALLTHAWLSGPVSAMAFGVLLHRRIVREERALGLTGSTN